MGKLFLITAPSGSGKTFLSNKLIKDGTWIEGISHTSRKMREGEVDGTTYYFTSKEDMETMIYEDKFVEYVEYDGNIYGMSKSEIQRGLANVKPMFIIVEYNGYEQIKSKYPEAIGIFLHMSKEDCMANMLLRGDSLESATKRIGKWDREIHNSIDFDYVVKNVRGKENETSNILRAIVSQYVDNSSFVVYGGIGNQKIYDCGAFQQVDTIYSGNKN